MKKTITVLSTRYHYSKPFRKWFSKGKKFHVHDEMEYARTGDKVVIRHCGTPVSPIKTYYLRNVVRPTGFISANDGKLRHDEIAAIEYNKKLRFETAQGLTAEKLDPKKF